MFLPILSPTAGAILGIVLFIYFIGVLLKDTANKIDVSPPKPTVKKKPVEPPFIDIAYNEIFPYDEVLSAYYILDAYRRDYLLCVQRERLLKK